MDKLVWHSRACLSDNLQNNAASPPCFLL